MSVSSPQWTEGFPRALAPSRFQNIGALGPDAAAGEVTELSGAVPATSANIAQVTTLSTLHVSETETQYLCQMSVRILLDYTLASTATSFTTDDPMVVESKYRPTSSIRTHFVLGNEQGGMAPVNYRLLTSGLLNMSFTSPSGTVAQVLNTPIMQWTVDK